jgi:hypothetical protein
MHNLVLAFFLTGVNRLFASTLACGQFHDEVAFVATLDLSSSSLMAFDLSRLTSSTDLPQVRLSHTQDGITRDLQRPANKRDM